MHQFTIDVIHDADAGVYVGTSEDIPGLTLETETVAQLRKVTMDVVPHLLSNNLHIPNGSRVKINVSITSSNENVWNGSWKYCTPNGSFLSMDSLRG